MALKSAIFALLPPADGHNPCETFAGMTKLLFGLTLLVSCCCYVSASPAITQDFGHFRLNVVAAKVQ